jgi:hypothetical protein
MKIHRNFSFCFAVAKRLKNLKIQWGFGATLEKSLPPLGGVHFGATAPNPALV